MRTRRTELRDGFIKGVDVNEVTTSQGLKPTEIEGRISSIMRDLTLHKPLPKALQQVSVGISKNDADPDSNLDPSLGTDGDPQLEKDASQIPVKYQELIKNLKTIGLDSEDYIREFKVLYQSVSPPDTILSLCKFIDRSTLAAVTHAFLSKLDGRNRDDLVRAARRWEVPPAILAVTFTSTTSDCFWRRMNRLSCLTPLLAGYERAVAHLEQFQRIRRAVGGRKGVNKTTEWVPADVGDVITLLGGNEKKLGHDRNDNEPAMGAEKENEEKEGEEERDKESEREPELDRVQRKDKIRDDAGILDDGRVNASQTKEDDAPNIFEDGESNCASYGDLHDDSGNDDDFGHDYDGNAGDDGLSEENEDRQSQAQQQPRAQSAQREIGNGGQELDLAEQREADEEQRPKDTAPSGQGQATAAGLDHYAFRSPVKAILSTPTTPDIEVSRRVPLAPESLGPSPDLGSKFSTPPKGPRSSSIPPSPSFQVDVNMLEISSSPDRLDIITSPSVERRTLKRGMAATALVSNKRARISGASDAGRGGLGPTTSAIGIPSTTRPPVPHFEGGNMAKEGKQTEKRPFSTAAKGNGGPYKCFAKTNGTFDLESLQLGQQINDNVIFAAITRMLVGRNDMRLGESLRPYNRGTWGTGLEDFEGVLLLPLHMSSHWALATLDFGTMSIEVFDSMARESETVSAVHLGVIQSFLGPPTPGKKLLKDWKLRTATSVQQMPKSNDCGVAVIANAFYLAVLRTRPSRHVDLTAWRRITALLLGDKDEFTMACSLKQAETLAAGMELQPPPREMLQLVQTGAGNPSRIQVAEVERMVDEAKKWLSTIQNSSRQKATELANLRPHLRQTLEMADRGLLKMLKQLTGEFARLVAEADAKISAHFSVIGEYAHLGDEARPFRLAISGWIREAEAEREAIQTGDGPLHKARELLSKTQKEILQWRVDITI
jgi:hypothetical protein